VSCQEGTTERDLDLVRRSQFLHGGIHVKYGRSFGDAESANIQYLEVGIDDGRRPQAPRDCVLAWADRVR
jgi:hypothetical protein